jgi:ABC-type sugar transport system permease subunit
LRILDFVERRLCSRNLAVVVLCFLLLHPSANAATPVGVRSGDYIEEAEEASRRGRLRYGEDFLARAKAALYRDFLVRNPDVMLVPFRTRHLPEGLAPTEGARLLFAMLGEAGPDHLVLDSEDFYVHREQNFLYPLDEYIFDVLKDGAGYPLDPEGRRLNPAKEKLFYKDRQTGKYSLAVPVDRRVTVFSEWDKLSPTFRSLSLHDGMVYGIPVEDGFTCLVVRRDLCVAAGLDPDSPPKDWDEFLYFAQKLTDFEKPIRGARLQKGQAGFVSALDTPTEWLTYLYQAGGDAVRRLAFCPDGHRIEVRKDAPFPQKCPFCGKSLLLSRRSWMPAFQSNAGLVAARYYRLLRSLRWTRCPRCGEPANVSREAEKTGALTCAGPRGCQHTFPLPQDNRIYRGVTREVERETERDREQVAAELFTTGEAAMVMVSQPYRFAASLPVSPEQVAMMPLPAGRQWVLCPRCRSPIVLSAEMKKGGKTACRVDGAPIDLTAATIHGGVSANLTRVAVWSINSSSTKECRDAAWRLIEYRMSDAAKNAVARSLVDEGKGHAVLPAQLLRAGYRDLYQSLPKSWALAERQSLLSGQLAPYAPNWSACMSGPIESFLSGIVSGETTDYSTALRQASNKCAELVRTESPGTETKQARGISGIVISAILLLLALLVWFYRSVRRKAPPVPRPLPVSRRVRLWPWLLLAPALACLLAWVFFPIFSGARMTVYDWLAEGETRALGALNFAEILSSAAFWRLLFQTIVFVGLTVAFGCGAPLVLAILLGEVPRGRHLFRAVFYLPALTSGLVVALLWRLILEPTERGFLNWLLLQMPRGAYLVLPFLLMVGFAALSALLFARREVLPGAVFLAAAIGLLLLIPRIHPLSRPVPWLANAAAGGIASLACIVFVGVWASAGIGSLVYLAALRDIPAELYDAAELDGAGIFAKLRHVTLVELKPLIAINLLGAVIGAAQAIRTIFVLTGGSPDGRTRVLALDVWFRAFVSLRFGYASALAWILASFVIGFSVCYLKRLVLADDRAISGGTPRSRQARWEPSQIL